MERYTLAAIKSIKIAPLLFLLFVLGVAKTAAQTIVLDTIQKPLNVNDSIRINGSGFVSFDSRLWFASRKYGIQYSADTGKTWTPCNKGIETNLVVSISTHADKIYCGTIYKGVYVYEKEKNRWFRLKNGITDSTFWALASNGEYFFASTEEEGFLRSKNGLLWEKVNVSIDNKIKEGSDEYTGLSLLFCQSSRIYVASLNSLFFSKDNGITWKHIPTPFGSWLGYISNIAGNDSTLALSYGGGGVYLSTNNGRAWKKAATPNVQWAYYSDIINGKLWVCEQSAKRGGLKLLEGDTFVNLTPNEKWPDAIFYYKGYYFFCGTNNVYRFKYP